MLERLALRRAGPPLSSLFGSRPLTAAAATTMDAAAPPASLSAFRESTRRKGARGGAKDGEDRRRRRAISGRSDRREAEPLFSPCSRRVAPLFTCRWQSLRALTHSWSACCRPMQ